MYSQLQTGACTAARTFMGISAKNKQLNSQKLAKQITVHIRQKAHFVPEIRRFF